MLSIKVQDIGYISDCIHCITDYIHLYIRLYPFIDQITFICISDYIQDVNYQIILIIGSFTTYHLTLL